MDHYVNQKKVLEINPRHPLIKKLLEIVGGTPDEEQTSTALDLSKFVRFLSILAIKLIAAVGFCWTRPVSAPASS